MKAEMEMAMKLLEKNVHEKQGDIILQYKQLPTLKLADYIFSDRKKWLQIITMASLLF
jgi:hypothetical protein